MSKMGEKQKDKRLRYIKGYNYRTTPLGEHI